MSGPNLDQISNIALFAVNHDVLNLLFLLVPGAGLEPALDFSKRILSPQRLPIPPPGQRMRNNGTRYFAAAAYQQSTRPYSDAGRECLPQRTLPCLRAMRNRIIDQKPLEYGSLRLDTVPAALLEYE